MLIKIIFYTFNVLMHKFQDRILYLYGELFSIFLVSIMWDMELEPLTSSSLHSNHQINLTSPAYEIVTLL
jgi:hypothetical protein